MSEAHEPIQGDLDFSPQIEDLVRTSVPNTIIEGSHEDTPEANVKGLQERIDLLQRIEEQINPKAPLRHEEIDQLHEAGIICPAENFDGALETNSERAARIIRAKREELQATLKSLSHEALN